MHSSISIKNANNEILIQNSNFYNNVNTLLNTNLHSYYKTALTTLFLDGNAKIKNSNFINNFVNGHGGAILLTSRFKYTIEKSIFEGNVATQSGGAIATLDQGSKHFFKLSISNSNFISNSILTKLNSDNYYGNSFYESDYINCPKYPTDSFCGGGGGAVSTYSSTTIRNSLFRNNSAEWGGALYISSTSTSDISNENSLLFSNCKFEENSAMVAGGSILMTTNHSVSFMNSQFTRNVAKVYGNDKATFLSQYSLMIDGAPIQNTQELYSTEGYYGKEFKLKVYNAIDKFNQSINELPSKFFEFKQVNNDKIFIILNNNNTQVKFHLQLNQNTYLESNSIFKITLFGIDQTFKIKSKECPNDRMIISNGICYLPPEPPILYIVIGVVIGCLIGIIIGSLSLYGCLKGIFWMRRKLKELKQKVEAEEEINRKLIHSFEMDIDGEEFSVINNFLFKEKSIVIPVEEIVFEKKIADGGFGSVYLGKCWKTTPVAIKTFQQGDNVDLFEKEVSILVRLRHPNIVSFYGVSITHKLFLLVMEYMKGGSLADLIYKCKNNLIQLTLKEKIKILCQAAQGINYLHGMKPLIVHRDLKPENLLINESGECKVADFGLSRIIYNQSTKNPQLTTSIGTLFYMSPEVILGDDSHLDSKEVTKIDVFSFSIIMWQLLFEETPYIHAENSKMFYCKNSITVSKLNPMNIPYQVATKNLRPMIPFEDQQELYLWIDKFMTHDTKCCKLTNLTSVVSGYVSLMEQCWDGNPKNRPSFQVILKSLQQLSDIL